MTDGWMDGWMDGWTTGFFYFINVSCLMVPTTLKAKGSSRVRP
jgi:hypothetical protein